MGATASHLSQQAGAGCGQVAGLDPRAGRLRERRRAGRKPARRAAACAPVELRSTAPTRKQDGGWCVVARLQDACLTCLQRILWRNGGARKHAGASSGSRSGCRILNNTQGHASEQSASSCAGVTTRHPTARQLPIAAGPSAHSASSMPASSVSMAAKGGRWRWSSARQRDTRAYGRQRRREGGQGRGHGLRTHAALPAPPAAHRRAAAQRPAPPSPLAARL